MTKTILTQPLKFLPLISALILFVLAGIVLLSRDIFVNAAQQGTIVSLIPPDQAYVGELITVKLVVYNAQNLAGFQSAVHHDANNLYVSGAIFEKGLSQSGRDIMPIIPIRREDAVILGAGTCPVADCSDTQYNSAARYTQGVNGYVELAKLELIANAPGRYELILEDVQLIDPQGNQLGATTTNVMLEVNER